MTMMMLGEPRRAARFRKTYTVWLKSRSDPPTKSSHGYNVRVGAPNT